MKVSKQSHPKQTAENEVIAQIPDAVKGTVHEEA